MRFCQVTKCNREARHIALIYGKAKSGIELAVAIIVCQAHRGEFGTTEELLDADTGPTAPTRETRAPDVQGRVRRRMPPHG